jgi:hypothetical protein
MCKPLLAAVFALGTTLSAGPRHVPVWPISDPPTELAMPDWSDRKTWLKLALLLGAAVLVKMSFRKMQEDDDTIDE